MSYLISIFLTLTWSFNSFSCSEDGSSGFLPENSLNIPVGLTNGGISEKDFNTVIDKFEAIYSPIVSNLLGQLFINRRWSSGTVNANATQNNRRWIVNLFGGLARHPSITVDGFALILCHEIGHHLGGAPKISKWASSEGQADYFGTLKCLRQGFLNDDNIGALQGLNIPIHLREGCHRAWDNTDDRNICIRSGMAGASVSHLFASLDSRPAPEFGSPDPTVIFRSSGVHPQPQCRLDTFFQGALCEIPFNQDVSQRDEKEGTCNRSTGQEVGIRPLCWFRPKA